MLPERAAELELLTEAVRSAARGDGRLVLLAGEAGVGKSALVRELVQRVSGCRVGRGVCDPSLTPAPLRPLLDIAADWGGPLQDLLDEGADRNVLFGALLDELRGSHATVLVIEDVHWADEATLDLLRHLGRRVTGTRALVIVTYRDDETGSTHPLRQVLGDLATAEGLVRMRLAPLSRAAVVEMAAVHGIDGARLHEQTGGNPFFVTEVLASGADGVPATVRDAVLARASRLPPAARDALDAAAIVPTRVDLPLLEALSGATGPDIDACVEAGMLVDEQDGVVAFRHELARRAIEEALLPTRRLALHERAAVALAARPDADSTQIAYHAAAASDGPLALEHAVRAARRARELGAHREAAAHLTTALRFADALPDAARAALLEDQAEEALALDVVPLGLESAGEAVALRRGKGDARPLGRALGLLSQARWAAGMSRDAEAAQREAIAVLEPDGPSEDLANARAAMTGYRMLARDLPGALEWGERTIALAEDLGAHWALSRALNARGSAKVLNGIPGGREELERGIEVARNAGLPSMVILGWSNLGSASGEVRDYRTAEPALREAIALASARDDDARTHYATAWLARVQLEQGRWSAAESTVASVPTDRPETSAVIAITALTVLGRLRARRGQADAAAPLERAWRLAADTGDLQRLWPVAAARLELAWLRGETPANGQPVLDVLAMAVRLRHPWATGELALLLHRSGMLPHRPEHVAEPYALQLAGRHAEAAAAWQRIGCPYEQADALSESPDEQHLRAALTTFDELGAAPAASRARQRLRAMGARNVPRGPRASTAAHPAGLTAREVGVLELAARGLTDAEIAEELFISPKTVGHHVSAILRKLGATSRGQAGEIARAAGLIAQHGERRAPT